MSLQAIAAALPDESPTREQLQHAYTLLVAAELPDTCEAERDALRKELFATCDPNRVASPVVDENAAERIAWRVGIRQRILALCESCFN